MSRQPEGLRNVGWNASEELYTRMRSFADRKGLTMTEVMRAAVTKYLDTQPLPIPKRSVEKRSAVELFEKGYSASQIAAVLHVPYRLVLAEIAAAVDREVKAEVKR